MGYTKLLFFKNGAIDHGIEFRNPWGGAARIWDSLFDRYLKNPAIPYHTWLTGAGDSNAPLWKLAQRGDLPMFERAVHAFTFDRFYVKYENFPRLILDLKSFAEKYPVAGKVDHLTAWANEIGNASAEAVGLYATSVSENPWQKWNEETEEYDSLSLIDGDEVYEWLENCTSDAPTLK